ncbi:hypothetical protein STZ1_20672 [Bacillus subtilis]
MKALPQAPFSIGLKTIGAGMIPLKGVEQMRLLGMIFLIAAVAFILLGVFLKLAAFFFVSMLTLIAAIVLFTILKKNQHNQT